MLKTSKKHLPKGYPLANEEESKKFAPIFKRAFEIHRTAHSFNADPGPREGVLSPIMGRTKLSKAHYCDCYELAYQELKGSL
jgi:hypothetical protein